MSALIEQLDDRRAKTYARADLDAKARVKRGLNGPLKRGFDIVSATAALIFLSPFLLAIAVLIRMHDGGPAVFTQARLGKGGRRFTCFKFRTMVVDAEDRLRKVLAEDPEAAAEWERSAKLTNDPRITPVGRFLRKTSLDELPQLLNIIRGDMSVVGPRPIPTYEITKYEEFFPYYAAIRPGITGLWQVSGRSDTTYRERMELDAEYATTWTWWNDFVIILKTVVVVFNSRGAY